MSKTEKLKEGIKSIIEVNVIRPLSPRHDDWELDSGQCADLILKLLASMGAGFRVERELPKNPYNGMIDFFPNIRLARKQAYVKGQQSLLKAGWRPVEEIKEEE